MTAPSPEQIAEWRKAAALAYMADDSVNGLIHPILAYEFGYLRARTEQATEIAALKAQIAELMPLAKYAAWHLTLAVIEPDDVNELDQNIYNKVIDAALFEQDKKLKYQPNIEATITKLLKD